GSLLGITGFVVYALPILCGTLADRFGFRRSLMFAYLVLTIGYFLLGSLGPSMAWLVRKRLGLGIENVFSASACCAFAMFLVTLFFYQEPGRLGDQRVESIGTALKNMFVVLKNLRFVIFLLISSGFYIVFWQIWITMPLFMRTYVDPN